MRPRTGPGAPRTWVFWWLVLGAVTAAMVAMRPSLETVHVALVLLLVVLGASSAGGRTLGLTIASAAFLTFNFFFLPPYGTLNIARTLDWLVLATFLATSFVAAQLLHRANREAAEARARSDEIARLTDAAERAEAQRRMEALRNALLTSVSHDLRTPLTSIKGIAHEIAEGGDPSAAADIEAAADRLNLLIGDMLELSRIQAGAQRAAAAVETIDDLVGSALQQARSILGDRLVAIDSPEAMLSGRFVFTDALRILVNLLENAVKYSPNDQSIDLRIRQDGAMIELAVMDRGPGVPVEERERIFEPFYRSQRLQTSTWGTGLGLAVARGLAESQGGTVMHEPRDGGGSVFVLRLPAVSESAAS